MGRLIRILVVDDHPIVRDGLEALLTKTGGFLVAGRATDPAEAQALLAQQGTDVSAFDVVLCDLFFGGRPLGFELLTELVATPGAPPVVLFSQFSSDSLYRTAVEQGAAGYLVKDAPLTEIARALRGAVAGRSSLSLAALRSARESPKAPNARDRIIMSAVAHGATNVEIGVQLGLAEKTIEGRLAKLFRRYDVVSRAELVAHALAEGWINNGRTGQI